MKTLKDQIEWLKDILAVNPKNHVFQDYGQSILFSLERLQEIELKPTEEKEDIDDQSK